MRLHCERRWIFHKIDSQPGDSPDSTRWEAFEAKYADVAKSRLVPVEGGMTMPALVVGNKPWSWEDNDKTRFPFKTPEGTCSSDPVTGISPTAGKIIFGTSYCGPAPAWALDRGEFRLLEETWFTKEGDVVASYCVLASGLWPQVSYAVTG